jgi:hypothetical protein
MTAVFDVPFDEDCDAEVLLREEADDERRFDAFAFGFDEPLREELLREEPLFEALLRDAPLFEALLRDEPLLDEPLLDELLALLEPLLARLFGLDPFELPLEDLRFVPDRELAWAIGLLPESNAPAVLTWLTPIGAGKTHWVRTCKLYKTVPSSARA